MISPSEFYNELKRSRVDFFAGVPDSLLKNICAYITDNTDIKNNIITPNEGNAVALAAGYHLATGKIPLIYLQNSGIGNIINPITSLVDEEVYSIPMILLIGWRGEPGIKDEPQHVKQGRVTESLLDALEIPYFILDSTIDNMAQKVRSAVEHAKINSVPFAILVRKNSFSAYKLKDEDDPKYDLLREEVLEIITDNLSGDEAIVSTTGKTSRELFEIRERKGDIHDRDFLTVGSMGHTSSIALGIAISNNNKPVICIDGDGSAIMHLGAFTTIGELKPSNLIHIIINNGAHESVGGQPTSGFNIDFPNIAKSSGYEVYLRIDTKQELQDSILKILRSNKLTLLEIRVKKGSRADLGRPTVKPKDNKELIMRFLNR